MSSPVSNCLEEKKRIQLFEKSGYTIDKKYDFDSRDLCPACIKAGDIPFEIGRKFK